MTLESFEMACERCREQKPSDPWNPRYTKHGWCDTCQGQRRPKELRIVTLKKLLAARLAERMAGYRREKRPGTAATVRANNRNQRKALV